MITASLRSLSVASVLLLAGVVFACSGMHKDAEGSEKQEHAQAGQAEKHEADEDQDAEADEDEGEKEVITLAAAPAAVRESFSKLAEASAVTKVEKIEDEGSVRYEIEFKAGGAEQSATMAEGGEMIEQEREMSADSLPAAVRATLKRHFPDGQIGKAEAVQASYYEVHVTSGGQTHEVTVLATGDIED
jgi:hypothetical protein